MKYSEYSRSIHSEIGMKIYNKPLIKNNDGDISYIDFKDIISFCNEYKEIDENLIKDMLGIWSHEHKIKFYYYAGIINNNEILFPCHEWDSFRPILFILLEKISYFYKILI